MNLIDAIKSGRPFKRRIADLWVRKNDRGMFATEGSVYQRDFDAEEILADDWEIQEPSVTITRSEFWEAVKDSLVKAGSEPRLFGLTDTLANTSIGYLARRLGLE